MTRYYDSSALVRLFVRERESDALLHVIERDPSMAASELVRVEVPRAVRRAIPGGPERFDEVFERIHLVAVRRAALEHAARLGPPALRTLDAVHLASALLLREELDAFVAYDDRLLDAAASMGLPVESPGR